MTGETEETTRGGAREREREEEEGKNGEDTKDDETLNLEKDVQGA